MHIGRCRLRHLHTIPIRKILTVATVPATVHTVSSAWIHLRFWPLQKLAYWPFAPLQLHTIPTRRILAVAAFPTQHTYYFQCLDSSWLIFADRVTLPISLTSKEKNRGNGVMFSARGNGVMFSARGNGIRISAASRAMQTQQP